MSFDAHNGVTHMQTVDLSSLVRQFPSLMDRTLSTDITIHVYQEEGPFLIKAHPVRIQQALMNLVLFSLVSLPNLSEMILLLNKLEFKQGAFIPFKNMVPGKWACIAISDGGDYIDRETSMDEMIKYFSFDEQQQNEMWDLSLANEIIREHGGFIRDLCKEGVRTKYIVYFPLLDSDQIGDSKLPTISFPKGNQQTILVVEDNEAVLKATCDVLERLNYQVVSTTSSQEALALFDEQEFDLVMSDLVMPEMGGIALYKALREKDPQVKILIMSGYPMGFGTRELLESGKVDWVQKPLDIEEISKKVKEVIQR